MFSVFIPIHLLIYDLSSIFTKAKKQVHNEQNYDKDYDILRTKFVNEYDRLNPVTKKQAKEAYLKYIESRIP